MTLISADFVSLERARLIADLRQLEAAMRSTKLHGSKPFRDLDITVPQLRVVFLLAASEPMSMSPLAQELGITLSACTHLVDKLVRAGFVSRTEEPRDRRVVRCSLTDAGQALAARLRRLSPFEDTDFLNRLTVDELRIIVQAMSIFQRVVAKMQAERTEADQGAAHDSVG